MACARSSRVTVCLETVASKIVSGFFAAPSKTHRSGCGEGSEPECRSEILPRRHGEDQRPPTSGSWSVWGFVHDPWRPDWRELIAPISLFAYGKNAPQPIIARPPVRPMRVVSPPVAQPKILKNASNGSCPRRTTEFFNEIGHRMVSRALPLVGKRGAGVMQLSEQSVGKRHHHLESESRVFENRKNASRTGPFRFAVRPHCRATRIVIRA